MRNTLKVMAVAAAAAALKALADMAPDLLPGGLGDVVAVAIAAVMGYLLPSPLQSTRR